MTQDAYEFQAIANGMWKFADSVPVDRLVAVARGWAMGVNGDRYTDLHVRQCSKDQNAIGFKYALRPDGTDGDWKRQNQKFFHRMKEQLENMFGDEFVGWDVTSSACIII